MKNSLIENYILFIQIFIGCLFGSLFYIFDFLFRENISIISLFIIISIVIYYIQKIIIYPYLKIETKNIAISEWIGNTITITIHCFVFWSILLNIF